MEGWGALLIARGRTKKELPEQNQKTVKQLQAHIKGDARRVEREVQKVIKRVTQGAGVSGVHGVNVKTPQGVVEDWVRDLICELVGKHGIPASRVYDVVSSVSEAFGVKLVHAIRSCMGMIVRFGLTVHNHNPSKRCRSHQLLRWHQGRGQSHKRHPTRWLEDCC